MLKYHHENVKYEAHMFDRNWCTPFQQEDAHTHMLRISFSLWREILIAYIYKTT